ncbi:hypothetical protein [Acidisphaera sp. S103]|uniref:hypothetical protein n=1 Tax=Acidisphaera sp. S103 TaxID=1747223 RepID=UPI00131D0E2A|nr:hypothetical protein [Acidisphaera sp. S103]
MFRIVSAGLILLASPAFADEPCTPIHFARGATFAVVSGTAGTDGPSPCYTLQTGKGQIATLKFTKTDGNMAFTIEGLVDDRDDYTFKTEAKTYTFGVFPTLRSNPTPFSLRVEVR